MLHFAIVINFNNERIEHVKLGIEKSLKTEEILPQYFWLQN